MAWQRNRPNAGPSCAMWRSSPPSACRFEPVIRESPNCSIAPASPNFAAARSHQPSWVSSLPGFSFCVRASPRGGTRSVQGDILLLSSPIKNARKKRENSVFVRLFANMFALFSEHCSLVFANNSSQKHLPPTNKQTTCPPLRRPAGFLQLQMRQARARFSRSSVPP